MFINVLSSSLSRETEMLQRQPYCIVMASKKGEDRGVAVDDPIRAPKHQSVK
jgi:hypothetical protein